MGKSKWVVVVILLAVFSGCNTGMSSDGSGTGKQEKRDKGKRTVIDAADYTDFTLAEHDTAKIRKEDVLFALGGGTFSNGNSSITINSREGTAEITSDSGFWNGKKDCQIYGVFGFEVKAAGNDCLYLRKDPKIGGFILIDGTAYQNDAVPDLAVCLPLYGYSRNRIEVSPVMNGYIGMPSGTYWKKR